MPKRITVTLSDDLGEVESILRKRRHYRSGSEFFQGLLRYDAQTQMDHPLTAEWAAFSPEERDMLDAALLTQVKTGEGVKGSWFKAAIRDAVKEWIDENRDLPHTKDIAVMLAKKIIENAQHKSRNGG